ncbi:MAG: hypothetical protein JF616_14645 [Fibrobacteres bacterium]|nr:hypothetical protein [Fibrobacterota bacterium]
MAFAVLVRSVWSDCSDTTIVLKSSSDFTSGTGAAGSAVYNPAALNAMIHGCVAGSMTVHLNIDATESGKTKDTVKLSGPILIGGRVGKTTSLNMDRPATVPATTLDDMFTFTEGSTTNASLLFDSAGNTLVLSRTAFARKNLTSDSSTVNVMADGSTVTGCHFWMADKDGLSPRAALLNIGASSVLVERSLFRAPPTVNGYARAIRWVGTFSKLEARANVFFGTGLLLNTNGPFHVIANTFAGSRNQYNPIIIGGSIGTAFNNAVIMHNLFALKVDTIAPIVFNSPPSAVATDSILRNAWTQGKPSPALAVTEPTTVGVTIRGATGGNVNVALPRGFSNYGPNAGDVKDYPLTELRTDSTLSRKSPDFGKIYRVFLTGSWAGSPVAMNDISTIATKMYFTVPSFAPFVGGKTWLANVKVGAFVDQDTITIPSPLKAGAQGASLKIQPDSSGSDKAKITVVDFDQDYYKQLLLPENAYFFFSNTLAKLTATNDTTALIASVGQPQRKQWTGFDNILTVPREVRNGPNVDIYVKMLHFRGSFMAAVQSNAAIATLSNFPGFPANDLTLSIVGSNSLNKTVDLKVTRQTEAIDSIRILTLNEGGQVLLSKSFVVPLNSVSISPTITVPDKGRYFFQAVPVASIGGGVFKAGSPTLTSAGVDIGLTTSDSVYVTYTATCPGADGTIAKPYCLIDSALKVVAAKSASTIIISNGTIPMTDITIDSVLAPGSSNITITALPPAAGHIDDNRPVFLGDKKDALTIARRNVTLRGFLIEQPAAGVKAGLAVNAGGCLIDGNIFRAHTIGSVEAPAITVAVGSTADVRIINNVVWGFAKGVQLSSSSTPNLKIMFNSFVADTAINKTPTSGISTSSSDDVAAVVADNFFSGLTDPIDASLALKHPVLDHNVYTAGVNLHNLSESGGLGASSPVRSSDITASWTTKYATAISQALRFVVECSSLAPCNPLYGGSSANDYSVSVTTDAFAQVRKNRKDVGAYEYPPAPSAVMGVVEIHPTLVQGTFRQIGFTVSGKSFDPDPQETDSVQVFWLTSDVTGSIDANLTPVPSAQHKKYPISKLVSGNITDTADGIQELKKYWFYAALSRYSSGRAMGYAYSDTITSKPNVQDTDCNFSESKTACPSETGIFGVDSGAWKGKFETTVLLTQATDSGLVKVPRFITVTNLNQYGLDLTSPLPMFYLDASVKTLGAANSKQKLTWEVQLYFNPELSGLDLFLLPSDASGKPTLVPDWYIKPLGGGKFSINFESTVNGPQVYAFGKVQAAPGTVSQSDAQLPIYDFNTMRDSASHVTIHIKGAGFKTANPLVLISAIPAGGTVYVPAGSRVPKVISASYPIKTVVASSGYSNLDPSLRMTRLHDLYMKAFAAEAADVSTGAKKPFLLDSVSAADFPGAVDTLSGDLDLSGGEMTVKIPFSKFYNDNTKYPDQVGKSTRSVEVVMTVFDGSKISRTRGFIRTLFRNGDIHSSEFYNRGQGKRYSRSTNENPHWNLFGFPWDESQSASLARILGKDKWDQDNMRLMQYLGTGEGAGAFTAYDGTNASAFRYDSGMAVWSGSTSNYIPISDSGMSLDFQPFVMSLAPNRYYDVSLPFNFPMKWQDVLDSSGLTGPNAPAMWRYNDTASKWVAVQAAAASPPSVGAVLYPWEGYTIKATVAQTLTFPVADTTRTSKATAKVAAANDGSWAVYVEARDATAAMDLRIGRGAREILFPEAPNVPGQDFRVSLLKGEDKVSQYIQPLDGGLEGNWALQAVSAKGSGGLSLRISEATREIPVWLLDATHAKATPLTKDQAVTVSEGDLKANDYHLVAGDKDYLDRIMQSLVPGHLLALSNYPNPFSGSTLIRYSLPAAFGRTTFDLKVRDFRGRTVWEKTIESGNALNFMWDGHDRTGMPLPAGIYNLSLTTKSEGKPAYRAQRNLLRM